MKEGKLHSFITGALVGVGLGLLFAPNENIEAKQKLKESLNNLLENIKEIDVEQTKAIFMKRLSEIKEELGDLSDNTKKELVKLKLNHIKTTCKDLFILAEEKKAVKVASAAKTVEEKINSILLELESENNNLKETTPKKKITNIKTKKRTTKKTPNKD